MARADLIHDHLYVVVCEYNIIMFVGPLWVCRGASAPLIRRIGPADPLLIVKRRQKGGKEVRSFTLRQCGKSYKEEARCLTTTTKK